MKVLLILSMMISCSAFARTVEKLVTNNTTNIDLVLNDKTVRCSDVGYGNMQLKVNVPDLKYLAYFNHTNFGETEPCITAGRCVGSNVPGSVIDTNKPDEKVDINVVTVEITDIDDINQKCYRRLEERISANIRGRNFTHVRAAALAVLPYSLCNQI